MPISRLLAAIVIASVGCGYQPPLRTQALPVTLANSERGEIAGLVDEWALVEARFRAALYREDGGKAARVYGPTVDSTEARLVLALGVSPPEALFKYNAWREAARNVLRIQPRNLGKPYSQDLVHKEEMAYESYCHLLPQDTSTCHK